MIRPSAGEGDRAALTGKQDRLQFRGCPQLRQGVADVIADRVRAQVERLGNRFCRATICQQLQDLALALGDAEGSLRQRFTPGFNYCSQVLRSEPSFPAASRGDVVQDHVKALFCIHDRHTAHRDDRGNDFAFRFLQRHDRTDVACQLHGRDRFGLADATRNVAHEHHVPA